MLKQIAYNVMILLFCAACTSNNKQFTNDKVVADSLFKNYINPTLDNSQLKQALTQVDSIYNSVTTPNTFVKIHYYHHKGWMNNNLGNYEKALLYTDTLIDIFKNEKLQNKMANEYGYALFTAGNACFAMNNIPKAYNYYFEASQTVDVDSVNAKSKTFLFNQFGLVLYKQQQYKEAIIKFKKVVQIINKILINDKYFTTNQQQETLDNIGLCFTKLHEFDSAKYYYNLSLQKIEEYKNICGTNEQNSLKRYATFKGIVLGNLAKIYTTTNKLDTAITLYKEAIYLNTKYGVDAFDAELCVEQLAKIYLQKNDYSSLKQTLDILKLGLDTLPNLKANLGWQQMMAAYYNKNNNAINEIKHYKAYIVLKDSFANTEKDIQQTTITKELKDKEQQLQITVLQKDNQLSKLYLWIVAAACFVAAIIAFLVYRSFRKTKQLNEQVNLQKQALEKANKDKDSILNVVAHDLRNPIGAIANFLDIAQVKYEHSEDEEQILKTSQQAAVHSLTLINDLLEINQMQDGLLTLCLATIDVEQLITQSIEQLKYKAIAKQQSILLQTSNEKYVIKADAEKLQRVITNLIDNAIKFSFLETEIIVALEQKDNYVAIKITDSGVGIPLHIIEQLFTASITIKRTGTNNEKSNGLGLSICKQIIEAHNGKILVESREGKGSCFSVLLPC